MRPKIDIIFIAFVMLLGSYTAVSVDSVNEIELNLTEDFVIFKKNITRNFRVDMSTLTEDNLLISSESETTNSRIAAKSGSVTEKYVPLPSGKYFASSFWAVSTRGYGQKSTALYFIPNVYKD